MTDVGEVPEAAPVRPGRVRRLLAAWPLAVPVAVAGLVSLVEPARVDSGSMAPALQTGQHVVIDKLTYRFAEPAAGDVVVFDHPGTGEASVKRVAAVGGQRLAIEDGVLVVDGEVRHQPGLDMESVDSEYVGPLTVPEGTVFVVGDDRANSIDSRSFGPVPVDDISGRVVARIWPPARP